MLDGGDEVHIAVEDDQQGVAQARTAVQLVLLEDAHVRLLKVREGEQAYDLVADQGR